jgi:hypothetical protein
MTEDILDGNRIDPYITIQNRIIKTPEHIRWTCSAEFPIYLYLQASIIRSPLKNPGIIDLYHEYYLKKNLLAARWRLEDIATAFGFNNKSSILRPIKSMEDKGYIKIEPVRIGKIKLNVYIFGTHDDLGHEFLYAYMILAKINAANIIGNMYEATQLN